MSSADSDGSNQAFLLYLDLSMYSNNVRMFLELLTELDGVPR